MITVSIHTLGIGTSDMMGQEILRTRDIVIIPTIEKEATQLIKINEIITKDHEITQTTDQITKDLTTAIIKIDHGINSKIGTQTITIDKKNYSQSPHRNNTRYPDSQNKLGRNTPTHQRQINQVQTTRETNSDPPGIYNTESTEIQLNHINCESTDIESDTENTILVNMIEVEKAYENVTYEQLFHSHVYEN